MRYTLVPAGACAHRGLCETPAMSAPVYESSAGRLARSIREGHLTSSEVVEAHIDRIRRVNPVINAVVEERFDEALKEATVADERTRSSDPEELPPLHGVPCTVKEVFAFPGMRQTAGMVARRDHVASEEATAVTRLREAGAIIMGTTNVSELCMWMETTNKVYGRTRNAYDPARIAGGSSGGEGAIVGAGASPFGLGADIGGSIRMPSFFNGVFGHKATGGLVPGTGQFPSPENEALRYNCTGPIARRAEDLMPLLRILAGPDGVDTACHEQELGDPASVDVSGLRVVDVRGNGFRRISPELDAAQERAAQGLASIGCDVRRARIASLKRSLDMWAAMMADAADTTFADHLYGDTAHRPVRELGRLALRRSDHTLPAVALTILERAADRMPKRTQHFVEQGRALADEIEDFVGDHGVMLFPSYTSVAPKHNAPLFPPVNWVYTAVFNIAQVPVTQVPLGLNDQGLPLGVQVVGARGQDHLTIATALKLEKLFGGWRMPPFLSGDQALVAEEVP